MKYLYITIAILILFYSIYYLSPVEYKRETTKSLCKEEPTRLAQCKNICLGVPVITCRTQDLCTSECSGQCYGAVSSSCSNYEVKKLGPIELAKSIFDDLDLF